MKLKTHKKKIKASLTVEFAFLFPIMMMLFLMLTSLLFTHQIQVNIETSMSEALLEISDDIYLASKLYDKTDSSKIFGAVSSLAEDLIGIKINLGKTFSYEILKNRIRSLTYEKMNLESSSPPFWFTKDFEFEIESSVNGIYCSSIVEIKLPIISKFIGNVKLKQKAVQASRGIEMLGSINKTNNKARNFVITSYSMDKSNSSPVYHDKNCLGRIKENKETSTKVQIEISDISANGDIKINGRIFHYCKFCKENKLPKRKVESE